MRKQKHTSDDDPIILDPDQKFVRQAPLDDYRRIFASLGIPLYDEKSAALKQPEPAYNQRAKLFLEIIEQLPDKQKK